MVISNHHLCLIKKIANRASSSRSNAWLSAFGHGCTSFGEATELFEGSISSLRNAEADALVVAERTLRHHSGSPARAPFFQTSTEIE
jgi:hypothetical protein